MKLCRVCRAIPNQKHDESCLFQGIWLGKANEKEIVQANRILKSQDTSEANKLSASLFLQDCIC